ncbi:MAG: T9SS type A sorting domain-containing protein [Saprospiraceae bacterium]|nr:T9SS type A sorting domain-containing protein [Saprospiraceae bacterium]
MNVIQYFFCAFLILAANPIMAETPSSCSLPAPDWLIASDITSSSIEITWDGVNGSYGYLVERFDVTHGVRLPDVQVAEPEYVSGPHDQGTTITFTVYPVCENEELGAPVSGEYTTTIIIVDVIAMYNVPNPQGDVPIAPSGFGGPMAVSLTDADKNTPNVEVYRLKIKSSSGPNPAHYADIILWSRCSYQENSAVRIMYWEQSSWPPEVTYVENHPNGYPFGPIISISFFINNQPFFTVLNPGFTQGSPHQLGIQIRNDRLANIFFDRGSAFNKNPCYVPAMQGGGDPVELAPAETMASILDDDSMDNSVAETLESTTVLVYPNPFENTVYVRTKNPKEGGMKLTLMDLTGREVKSMQYAAMPAGTQYASFHIDGIPAGTYLLGISDENEHRIMPVVKNR